MELLLPDPSVSSFKALMEYMYTDKCDSIQGFKMALSIYLNTTYLSMDTERNFVLYSTLNVLAKHFQLLAHCISVIDKSVTNSNCLVG
jgi:hypothetical protein